MPSNLLPPAWDVFAPREFVGTIFHVQNWLQISQLHCSLSPSAVHPCHCCWELCWYHLQPVVLDTQITKMKELLLWILLKVHSFGMIAQKRSKMHSLGDIPIPEWMEYYSSYSAPKGGMNVQNNSENNYSEEQNKWKKCYYFIYFSIFRQGHLISNS